MKPDSSKRDPESSSSAPPLAARLVEPPLAQLRALLEDYKRGTPIPAVVGNVPGKHRVARARREVDTIHKTLDVVIGEIDRLQAGRLVDPLKENANESSRTELSTPVPEVRQVLRSDHELRPALQTEQAPSEESRSRVQGLGRLVDPSPPAYLDDLRHALADCLEVIDPLRDELRKQGREDAATCCDEVFAFGREALAQPACVDPSPLAQLSETKEVESRVDGDTQVLRRQDLPQSGHGR